MSANETHKEKMKRKKMERANRGTSTSKTTSKSSNDGWGIFDWSDVNLNCFQKLSLPSFGMCGNITTPYNGGRISNESKLFFFKSVQSLKTALTKKYQYGVPKLDVLINLDNLTKICSTVLDSHGSVWEKECDRINAPYDDLTNFRVVDVEDCPKSGGVLIKIQLNGVTSSPITDPFLVTYKGLRNYFVCSNQSQICEFMKRTGVLEQVAEMARLVA